jgi:hypothetical protein
VDFGSFIALAMFVLWILSKLATSAKRDPEVGAPPRPPPPPPISRERQARRALQNLGQLEKEMEAALPQFDSKVREQTAFVFERSFRGEAERLGRVLGQALGDEGAELGTVAPGLAPELQNAQALLSSFRAMLQTARAYSGLRRRPDILRPQEVADRLAEDFYLPFQSFAESERLELTQGPPVPLVWDTSVDDRMLSSPLAPGTIFVPRSVTVHVLHWSVFGQELGRYLSRAAPFLYEEIYESLELQTPVELELGSDSDALARLLFASSLGQILGDAVGALLFGPSYLRAVSVFTANPQIPSRVTSVYFSPDGTELVIPAHLRVHLSARWLERMGFSGEAGELCREWDERHGSPSVLFFPGTSGGLPLPPLLSQTTFLLDQLFDLELRALAGTRLSQLPGLADWNLHQRHAFDARGSLLAGKPAAGSARALVAAAMEAVSGEPALGETVRAALYDSIHAPPPPARPPVARRTTKSPTPPIATSWGPPSARDVAEALILGEILLRPRYLAR